MESPGKAGTPLFITCMNALNTVTHFLLGAITICAFAFAASARGNISIGSWNINWTSSMAQHIILCVIGYVMLMSQAFLVFNPYVGWSSNLPLARKRLVHIILQICGSSLALIGCFIKMSDNTRNFGSFHAYMGFIAMLFTIITLVVGILNFIFSDKSEKNNMYQLVYTSLNAVTLSFAFIALAVAFSGYYRNIVPNGIANWVTTLTVFGLLGLLSLVYMKYISKKFN